MTKGLVHIYTGEGKGKTTATVGLAVRARSRGLSVIFARFMKEDTEGEARLLSELGVKVITFSEVLSPLFNPGSDIGPLQIEARNALATLKKYFDDGRYDMAILDEFITLIDAGLLDSREAEEFVRSKPENLELVLSGRGAPPGLIALSDYVTELREVKHPFSRGVQSREGIEY